MPDVNFYLKFTQPDKKGRVMIIAQINFNYKKFRKSLEKVDPKYWNKKKQRVRKPRNNEKYNRYVEINSILDEFETNTKSFFNDCIRNRKPVTENCIKDYMTGKLFSSDKQLPFFEAFEAFLESKKADRAKWTIKGYKTVYTFLKSFKEDMDIDFSYESIDLNFFDSLKKYAFDYKNLKDNYFAKIIAVLKNFMAWSEARNFHNNSLYKRFSYTEKEIDIVFLTIDELKKLYHFEFEYSRHSRVRDLFCFSCFTGLRYSDITSLRHEHIKNGYILKKIQKTRKTEKMYLNDFALQILEKYKDLPLNALPHITGQKANQYIKEACEIVGIDSKTIKTESRGGMVKEYVKPKYELITMHTGRKTFVTNSLILGMDVKAIMGFTGHKKDSTFNKYLAIVEEYKKAEMDKTWNKIDKKKED